MFTDVLLDTMIDCLKLLPFLFLTYLAMEYLEHKTQGHMNQMLLRAGKFGPAIGAVLGVFPQCGFSAAAANLYAGRVISMGTLAAVFLSTSDEMLPIFISHKVDGLVIVRILAAKVLIGLLAGLLVDFVYHKLHRVKMHQQIHDLCEHEHCHCEEGIVRSALTHTLQIFFFIFVVSLALNGVLSLWGEDKLRALGMQQSLLSVLVMGVIGLIPNCASSVVVTELYLEGIVSTGAMMSGLLMGAGVGILILFRVNKHVRENLRITGVLYVLSILSGMLIDLLGVTF